MKGTNLGEMKKGKCAHTFLAAEPFLGTSLLSFSLSVADYFMRATGLIARRLYKLPEGPGARDIGNVHVWDKK